MDYDDIHSHLISSEILFLLEDNNRNVVGMAAYTPCDLAGIKSLIVDGIAIDPSFQAKGVFAELTDLVSEDTEAVCLRTQNPHMYRALERYCSSVHPGESSSDKLRTIHGNLVEKLECKVDENGIVKGYFGGLFYGKKPHHPKISNYFDKLGMNLDEGDALIAAGLK
jgi:hypothetical protein